MRPAQVRLDIRAWTRVLDPALWGVRPSPFRPSYASWILCAFALSQSLSRFRLASTVGSTVISPLGLFSRARRRCARGQRPAGHPPWSRGLLLTPYVASANILSTKHVLAQVRDQLARYAGQVRQDLVFTDVGVPRFSGAGRAALDWPWRHR